MSRIYTDKTDPTRRTGSIKQKFALFSVLIMIFSFSANAGYRSYHSDPYSMETEDCGTFKGGESTP